MPRVKGSTLSIEQKRKISISIHKRLNSLTPEENAKRVERHQEASRKAALTRAINRVNTPKPPKNVKYGWKKHGFRK